MSILATAEAPLSDREREAAIAESISEAIEFLSLNEASLAHMVLGNDHRPSPRAMDSYARAYTNGKRCFYSTEFSKWTIRQRCGVIVHEWAHCGLDHVRRFRRAYEGDVSKIKSNPFGQSALSKVFNAAADLVINSWIQNSPSHGEKGSFTLPENVITCASFPKEEYPALWARAERLGHRGLDIRAVCDMTTEQVYDDILKDCQDGISCRLQKLLEQIEDMIIDDETERSEGSVDDETASVQLRRMCGVLAGSDRSGLLRRLADAFPKPAVDWVALLRRYEGDHLGSDRERTWSRRCRRSAYRGSVDAGRRPERIPKAVFILDTSGSMPDDLMTQICGEALIASRTFGAEIIVRAADVGTESRHIIRPGDTAAKILSMAPKGGGGTDFEGPLREAEEDEPDLVVYGTDMYGDLDFKPRIPVVWLTRTRGITPKYGKVILLPSD
mgnify:CR=1 FL=1